MSEQKNQSVTMIPLEKMIVLSKVALFSMLKTETIQTISKMTREKNYLVNTLLFSQNETCESLFIIVSGEVVIFRTTEKGEEKHIATLKENDFLGELSLFDAKAHTASARCLKQSKFLVIGRDEIEGLIYQHPKITLGFLQALISRMRAMIITQTEE
jgi:CRP/FNR family transcriptional regulator